jgi:hypothetical protein
LRPRSPPVWGLPRGRGRGGFGRTAHAWDSIEVATSPGRAALAHLARTRVPRCLGNARVRGQGARLAPVLRLAARHAGAPAPASAQQPQRAIAGGLACQGLLWRIPYRCAARIGHDKVHRSPAARICCASQSRPVLLGGTGFGAAHDEHARAGPHLAVHLGPQRFGVELRGIGRRGVDARTLHAQGLQRAVPGPGDHTLVLIAPCACWVSARAVF